MKKCPVCNETKPPDRYHALPHTSDGLNWRCIPCQNAYNREYQRNRSLSKCDPLVLAAIKFAPYERVTRFARKVKVLESGCWRWTGNCHPDSGYGRLWFDRHDDRSAHRLSYEWSVGPIPEGLTIDHLCRNRWCVNPEHLEPVTNAVNVMRGNSVMAVNFRKTECLRGHPFDAVNTRVVKTPIGFGRACKECERIRKRERRLRKSQPSQASGERLGAHPCADLEALA
jgi:hypothetical protein